MGVTLTFLIAEAEAWRREHRAAGRQIEALAAAIRLKALRDAEAVSRRSTPDHKER